MNKEIKVKPLLSVILIWLICFAFRALDYFFLRTDQTILGEAFVHKLLGVLAIFITAKIFTLNNDDIGFEKKGIFKGLLKGLGFGIITFLVAYITEIAVLLIHGNACRFDFYITVYSANGNIEKQTGFIFFLICIVGSIINTVMEEGMFRGVFQKILEKKYTFTISAIFASILFGLWQIIIPIRNLYDGTISTGDFVANSIMLVGTAAFIGFKFAMMTKITGNLYMAMGDHFVTNTIINIIHVLSKAGIEQQTVADQLLATRILVAQSVSFVAVLIWFLIDWNKKRQKN